MEQNNQSMNINNANPSMLWVNVASYLANLSKKMNKTYTQKRQKGEEITWAELDEVNKTLHHQLDIIVSGDINVEDNTAPKYESKMPSSNRVKLTESKLHRIIKESVKRVLKEGFTKPSNWKDTPFKGTYEDEDGALYMPDDDYGNEGFPYMIVTYMGEEEVNREYVTLPKPNLHTYDDEVPFSLGSNQALIELD